jgi:hypothetical protein
MMDQFSPPALLLVDQLGPLQSHILIHQVDGMKLPSAA